MIEIDKSCKSFIRRLHASLFCSIILVSLRLLRWGIKGNSKIVIELHMNCSYTYLLIMNNRMTNFIHIFRFLLSRIEFKKIMFSHHSQIISACIQNYAYPIISPHIKGIWVIFWRNFRTFSSKARTYTFCNWRIFYTVQLRK